MHVAGRSILTAADGTYVVDDQVLDYLNGRALSYSFPIISYLG